MSFSRPSKAGVLALTIIALAVPLPVPGAGASGLMISGAGATFPAPLIENWTSTYQSSYPNVSISYSAVGSSTGIHDITQGTIDFAASDSPLTNLQLQTFPGLTLFPEALGGVALAYNALGVPTSVSINFTSDVIAEIYNGTVTTWNDPSLQLLNPGVQLPGIPIFPVHRSDASGTTYTFARFLSATNSWWANNVGLGTIVHWPGNASMGVSGDAGVAGFVSGQSGAVGYVGLSYAKQSNLGIGAVENSYGSFITPTLQAIAYAAANATVTSSSSPSDMRQNIVNAAGAGSYPLSTYTYIIVWKDMSMDPRATVDKAVALARFLWWAVHDGQASAPTFFFAPLPAVVVGVDETLLRFLTYSGQQLLPPQYVPGVQPGDEATYGSVSASWASNIPPSLFPVPVPSIIQPFLNASKLGLVVETVSGASVTAAQTISYPNGTSHSNSITGNLATNSGNLTFWIVAGGLRPGDHLWGSSSGIFSNPMINYTITRVFAGGPRLLNVYNATFIYSGADVAAVACWDQATGVLVAVDIAFSFSQTTLFGTFYAKGSGSARLTETNLWSASASFKLNSDSLIWDVNSGSGQSIRLIASSLGGFSGQVTIMVIVPMGIQVSGLPVTLNLPASSPPDSTIEVSVLTVSVPASVAEGTYSLVVTGSIASGVSRSLTFTVNVMGDFAFSRSGSSWRVQTGGAVKGPLELYSMGTLGQVGLTVSVSPGGLTAAVANSSLVLSPGAWARTNLTVTADRGIMLGSYTVTVTATKGGVSGSIVENVTVTTGPVPASTTLPSKILGLDPPVFYGIVAIVALSAVVSVLVVWRRARRTVPGPQPGP